MPPEACFPNAVETPPLEMPRPASRREVVLRTVEWLIVIGALAFLGGRVLPRAWTRLNTDFPNYYVTARLVREGYSLTHLYEWTWLQRQKDHMGILRGDQPVVGFVPHTPFSALVIWPLSYWSPLTAKHLWILFNILLLFPVATMLRRLTGLEWRRILLLFALSYPLFRNLEYGQYYIVILALLTIALSLYLRRRSVAAGFVVGFAAGLKIFPVFFAFYFARKRDVRALLGLLAGVLATVGASMWVFGLGLHRTYFSQVLPWALRGDAMNPYALSPNSISALLHKLFIFEPEWNPHPAINAPLAYAVLHPLLQLLILAPAIFLVSRETHNSEQVQLEWSCFVVAILTISTLPASYHFTLLILPAAILGTFFLRQYQYAKLALLLVAHLAIGFPAWPHVNPDGWRALAAVPRLYLLLLLCGLCYSALRNDSTALRRDRRAWAGVLTATLVIQVISNLADQHRAFDAGAFRISTDPRVLSASQPIAAAGDVSFVAMKDDGYTLAAVGAAGLQFASAPGDQLSHAATPRTEWTEIAGTRSDVWKQMKDRPVALEIHNAEFPVASSDGRWLAYQRSSEGRASLWLRSLSDPTQTDTLITSPDFDVNEMTFSADGAIIFSAAQGAHPPALYTAIGRTVTPLNIENARYPAVSPDRRWIAYSHLQHGVWNLWMKSMQGEGTRRITTDNCNDISPAWAADSKTLIYASDCGRALWFTALYQRRVRP